VENTTLNIAIADVPEPFVLEANQDVEEVKARRTAFEEATGGRYHGNRELATPHGPAYTARGTIEGSDGVIEEIWIYTIHPSEYRLLTLVYRYPSAEDSADRAAQLMSILGEVESVDDSSGVAETSDG
jgi:hypothetical protein